MSDTRQIINDICLLVITADQIMLPSGRYKWNGFKQQESCSCFQAEKTYLAIDDSFRDVEFSNHAQRNSSTARLSVIHLTFEDDSVDSIFLGEDFSGASTRRTSTYNGNGVSHVKGRFTLGGGNILASEARRGREGGGNRSGQEKNGRGELHFGKILDG